MKTMIEYAARQGFAVAVLRIGTTHYFVVFERGPMADLIKQAESGGVIPECFVDRKLMQSTN